MAVNPEELAICRKRGHQDIGGLPSGKWEQCQACGMWVREVRTIEEREEAPPQKDRGLDWQIAELNRQIRKKPSEP